MTSNGIVIDTYPRTRPPLPPQQAAVYEHEYAINRAGTGLLYRVVHKLESWMHNKIAAEQVTGPVLELGAGGLTHIPLEPMATEYDVVEPVSSIVKGSPNFGRINRYYSSYEEFIQVAKSGGPHYAKIFSVAVLEHLADLPAVVAAAALSLGSGGSFQAGIPTEGGFLWGLSWRSTTGLAYRARNRVSYEPLMRHEHINNADDINAVIRHFFGFVTETRFPFPAKHASVYTYIRAVAPKVDVAVAYLDARNEV